MGKLARPVLASVFAALAVAVALCVVHAPVYATPPDDFVQELFARGQFQAAASGGLMPYSLVLVSAPLSALYALAPAVPWYALMLLALIVVSFSVAYYRASALGLARWQLACVMCALITCEVLCVLYFTFTMVAFVSLAAGLMLILPRATLATRDASASPRSSATCSSPSGSPCAPSPASRRFCSSCPSSCGCSRATVGPPRSGAPWPWCS